MSQKPFKILGIEHIGIAVNDLDGLSNVFSDILGLRFLGTEKVDDQKVKSDIYDSGGGKLEFLKSTSVDSPLHRYVEKNGAGLHHIALKVDNLQSALNHLLQNGIELIDKVPKRGAEGHAIAFLHPKSTAGILIELCEAK